MRELTLEGTVQYRRAERKCRGSKKGRVAVEGFRGHPALRRRCCYRVFDVKAGGLHRASYGVNRTIDTSCPMARWMSEIFQASPFLGPHLSSISGSYIGTGIFLLYVTPTFSSLYFIIIKFDCALPVHLDAIAPSSTVYSTVQ